MMGLITRVSFSPDPSNPDVFATPLCMSSNEVFFISAINFWGHQGKNLTQ